jgi:hypothetical protein
MRKKILKYTRPFWRNVKVAHISSTNLWRVSIVKKPGLTLSETKNCAYAILDEMLGEGDRNKYIIEAITKENDERHTRKGS